MATSFLGLTVKVHGSYVKKATGEAPMELEFTKFETIAARTLRVWKGHTSKYISNPHQGWNPLYPILCARARGT